MNRVGSMLITYIRTIPLILLLLYSAIPVEASEHVYYYHNDHLGTPQVLTDEAGAVVWEAEYRPFGEAVINNDPDGDGRPIQNNLRFPGQYYDEESGLHYNWNRYYEPETGRYLQPDPIGLQPSEINLYLYAHGNPIAFVDPMGLYSEMCFRDIDHMPPSAQHCYVRRDGDPSSTTSYWAEKPVDRTPHVTGDLHPNAPAPCQKIRGSEGVCEKDFDKCIDEKMKDCEKTTYNIRTFNCCSCVEQAIAACGGTFDGVWPKNRGYGPQSK